MLKWHYWPSLVNFAASGKCWAFHIPGTSIFCCLIDTSELLPLSYSFDYKKNLPALEFILKCFCVWDQDEQIPLPFLLTRFWLVCCLLQTCRHLWFSVLQIFYQYAIVSTMSMLLCQAKAKLVNTHRRLGAGLVSELGNSRKIWLKLLLLWKVMCLPYQIRRVSIYKE